MRFVELKKDTLYILPVKTKFESIPFDTIYIKNDIVMLADSEHYKIDGVSLKELFNSKKGRNNGKHF